MPIQHAVLGLLADGPSYGYELKGSLEDAIGPHWGELNIGQLYQVLDRLVRDGLATGRTVRQENRPDKIVYRLTDAGQEELDSWLARPTIRRGYRDDLSLKLFVSSRLGTRAVRSVIRTQREEYLGELRTLGELRERHRHDPLVALLIEAAVLQTEASLRFLEHADEQARDLAKSVKPQRVDAVESPADRGRRSA